MKRILNPLLSTLFSLLTAYGGIAATLEITPRDGICETAAFEPGARLFTDRTYALAEAPAPFKGMTFLRAPIDGMRVRCAAPGTIYALTPPKVPDATSLADSLAAQGFERVVEPARFQLFGANAHERVDAYRKTLAAGDTLKLGKWCVLLGFSEATVKPAVKKPWAENSGERLYNGIVLPEEWPPENIDPKVDAPMPVPYLDAPPKVIPIDTGRQLFVDDFLIESTDLLHTYHMPEKHPDNPILTAETPLERRPGIVGGVCRPCVWWNPETRLFNLWYQAGTYFNGTIALATSPDGLRWTRPAFDVNPGSNQALPPGFQPDSYGIVPDWNCPDPQQRFKLFSTNPGRTQPAFSFTSSDGIHWINKTQTGRTGDRSSMFYNPFRKKWVYSLRTGFRGRSRNYRECDDFLAGAAWTFADTVPWLAADPLDVPEPGYRHKTQLYNFDAVAYESVMLGFFELHRGPENNRCEKMGLPKLNEISFGYSRDGFHFSRPDRRAHIPASRKDTWDRGFVESGGNICAVVGDKLYFYYSGCRGDMDGAIKSDGSVNWQSMYDPNAIGLCTLRRDGFASLDAGASSGQITTRPVVFSGKQLFVNADCPQGDLRAELLDASGNVLAAPLSAERIDATRHMLGDVSAYAGQPVRFRFTLRRGSLYAFWVSADPTGRSGGYPASGGPDE